MYVIDVLLDKILIVINEHKLTIFVNNSLKGSI